jgi:septation ring formation regulator EzrA
MEIQSAFNAGVQGFQKASEDAAKAAENIATNVVENPESYSIGQEANNPADNVAVQNNEGPVNLTQSIVDLRVAEFQAKASAEVVKSADENLGTLLDVRV